MPSFLSRIKPDRFTLLLLGTVLLAALLPARGPIVPATSVAADIAIVLLFFLHGARLPWEAVKSGVTHWRLHLVVFLTTFAVFPLLGELIGLLPAAILAPSLVVGMQFLCLLPSTVQSSIAFTSIAGGNVPAAICSASISNLVGIFLTPALVALLLDVQGVHISFDSIEKLVGQLLLPFVVGQVLRRWIGAWALRNKTLLAVVDRGSILLVVYNAFSAAVTGGLLGQLALPDLLVMAALNAVLLAAVLLLTAFGSRALGFSRPDRITIVFCGSKKSLVSGIPLAGVLFPAHMVGLIVLPLMIFHQFQLITCAWLAQRYAREGQAIAARIAAERDETAPAA